jgi:anti-sigma factor RsiW
MSHKLYLDWMHLALDEGLPPARRAELDGHLAECEACAAAWDALLQVDRLFASAPLAAPRAGFTTRFNARLQQRSRPRAVWGALALGFGAVGAAAFVLPVGVSLLWSLAQVVGRPAASAALLNSASATSEVGLALVRALFVAALALGEWAVGMPLFWVVVLAALLATGVWIYMLRRVNLQRTSS